MQPCVSAVLRVQACAVLQVCRALLCRAFFRSWPRPSSERGRSRPCVLAQLERAQPPVATHWRTRVCTRSRWCLAARVPVLRERTVSRAAGVRERVCAGPRVRSYAVPRCCVTAVPRCCVTARVQSRVSAVPQEQSCAALQVRGSAVLRERGCAVLQQQSFAVPQVRELRWVAARYCRCRRVRCCGAAGAVVRSPAGARSRVSAVPQVQSCAVPVVLRVRGAAGVQSRGVRSVAGGAVLQVQACAVPRHASAALQAAGFACGSAVLRVHCGRPWCRLATLSVSISHVLLCT